MVQVKALVDIKEDLAARKAALQKRLVLELERLVYHVNPLGAPGKAGSAQQQQPRPPRMGRGEFISMT